MVLKNLLEMGSKFSHIHLYEMVHKTSISPVKKYDFIFHYSYWKILKHRCLIGLVSGLYGKMGIISPLSSKHVGYGVSLSVSSLSLSWGALWVTSLWQIRFAAPWIFTLFLPRFARATIRVTQNVYFSRLPCTQG